PVNFLRLLRLGGRSSCQQDSRQQPEENRFRHVFLSGLFAANCFLLTAYCHFMTLSALNSTDCGIVRPICFAVFKLITSSNFVGCSTGRSAGFAPFRILST